MQLRWLFVGFILCLLLFKIAAQVEPNTTRIVYECGFKFTWNTFEWSLRTNLEALASGAEAAFPDNLPYAYKWTLFGYTYMWGTATCFHSLPGMQSMVDSYQCYKCLTMISAELISLCPHKMSGYYLASDCYILYSYDEDWYNRQTKGPAPGPASCKPR